MNHDSMLLQSELKIGLTATEKSASYHSAQGLGNGLMEKDPDLRRWSRNNQEKRIQDQTFVG